MVAPIVMGVIAIVGALLGGVISERFGRRHTMIVSRLLVIALELPMFLYVSHERTVTSLVVMLAVLGLVGAPGAVTGVTAMSEIFPRQLRAAGISLAYALTVTIFGGTTQFVIAWLVGVTGNPLAPAYYVIASSVVSVIAMVMLRETRDAKI